MGTANRCFTTHTNIRFGCWYLHFLDEGSAATASWYLAGYNAGHNRVAKWMDDSDISDGENLVNIPFEETDKYVKKVERPGINIRKNIRTLSDFA